MLELLSPAGSMDALYAAVQNGADAVYLGYGSFNARQGAKNFTQDALRDAVQYCHVRGVQVHLTLNTLVTDREMPQLAETIRLAARAGVDAFIVQDLGVLALCRQIAPGVALHASTQMSVHSLEGVRQAAALGVSRVVLARELSREQIAYICRNSPVEIEVFVHGALCMCYSGQCYLSAVIGRRSGNRGQCAQPCRLPYGYGRFEEKYPLSLKDNCLISELRELARMGVASVKIEGRMKRPEYVATATRIYRSAIDGAQVSAHSMRDLADAFSRQGFTQGYYRSRLGPEMFGTRVPGAENQKLFQAARASYESGETPRVAVAFYAIVQTGEPAMLAVQDENGNICKTVGAVPAPAVHKELTQQELADRLGKTGGTPYFCTGAKCLVGRGLSLSASAINAMRREVLSQLTALRGRREPRTLGSFTEPMRYPGLQAPPKLTVSVLSVRQITKNLLSMKPETLYVPLHELCENEAFFAALDTGRIAAVLPRVMPDNETPAVIQQLDRVYALGVRRVLLGNLGQISIARSRGFSLAGDFGLNCFNSRSMNALRSLGLGSATASFEMTLPQVRDMSKAVKTELIVYGRLPLMLTENCIMRNKTGACICQNGPVKLIDRMGEEFRIVRDGASCRSILLNGKKLYLLDKQPELRKLGLWALRLQFTTENSSEVNNVLTAYQNQTAFEPGGCTRGLYLRGVE